AALGRAERAFRDEVVGGRVDELRRGQGGEVRFNLAQEGEVGQRNLLLRVALLGRLGEDLLHVRRQRLDRCGRRGAGDGQPRPADQVPAAVQLLQRDDQADAVL